MQVKHFPGFRELFYQIIEPEEGVMRTPDLWPVSQKTGWPGTCDQHLEVRVVFWD